ncbi:MAG: NIPSNAP family protein [Rubripirellula sp.]
MKIIITFLFLSIAMLPTNSSATAESPQYYEIRSYLLGEQGDAEAIHEYLRDAFVPAMNRQNTGPIGVFHNAAEDESGSPRIVVVIPHENADLIPVCKSKLEKDAEYQKAAQSYLARGPKNSPYERIESELLVAMDCMPLLKVPENQLKNPKRVFELRVYESANERLGDLKVHMFNNGEVPIFLDCGIQPIFIGQAVIGPFTPNLSYLTAYPNEKARTEAWTAFRSHPDWQVLKKISKYAGTVSKIHKYVLTPAKYSQI